MIATYAGFDGDTDRIAALDADLLALVREKTAGQSVAISAVFVVSTLIGITTQVRLTAWCRSPLDARSVRRNRITTDAGSIPLLVAARLTPTGAGAGSVGGAALAAAPNSARPFFKIFGSCE